MRVFLVEDSPLMVERVVAMLGELDAGIEVIGQAATATDAVELIRKLGPDAVILDIRLAQGDGLAVLAEIKRDPNPPTIVMLTNYPHAQYRRTCLAAGAHYFFDKSTEFDRLREVFKGLSATTPSV